MACDLCTVYLHWDLLKYGLYAQNEASNQTNHHHDPYMYMYFRLVCHCGRDNMYILWSSCFSVQKRFKHIKCTTIMCISMYYTPSILIFVDQGTDKWDISAHVYLDSGCSFKCI